MATNTPSAPDFLPYGRQAIDEDDIAAVAAVLRGDWLTTGPAVKGFEASLSAKIGNTHAIAVSSGTAALHIAALALDLGPGDTVIVPTITFVATANAALYAGADVVFSDVDPETGLMGVEQLEEALERSKEKNVKAVFPVHLNGQSPDMESIFKLARSRGLFVVEDACHSLGGSYIKSDGAIVPIGSSEFSDISIFSFHPVKTIAMGEGGALTCRDGRLADRIRRLRNHGLEHRGEHFRDPDGVNKPWFYELHELGYNYRASDIHCALGASQLKKLDGFVARRRMIADDYDQVLSERTGKIRPLGRNNKCLPAWHLYAVSIDFGSIEGGRGFIMKALREKGIGTQVHYIPVHTQPFYTDMYGSQELPGANLYYDRCLSLPLYIGLEGSGVERVVETLNSVLDSRS